MPMSKSHLTLFIIALLFLLPILSAAEAQDDYFKKLDRELNEQEKFLESILEDLIEKGDKQFIETLIYRMGYEKAKEKTPKLFFVSQFGGGPLVQAGFGMHIYNRQFYSYFTGGYTNYGKYKDWSGSFINEVRLFELYIYKRHKIDLILGANITYFSYPGIFISSIEFKQLFYFHDLELFGLLPFSPYTTFNLFFDKSKPQFQIGIGINWYPWG